MIGARLTSGCMDTIHVMHLHISVLCYHSHKYYKTFLGGKSLFLRTNKDWSLRMDYLAAWAKRKRAICRPIAPSPQLAAHPAPVASPWAPSAGGRRVPLCSVSAGPNSLRLGVKPHMGGSTQSMLQHCWPKLIFALASHGEDRKKKEKYMLQKQDSHFGPNHQVISSMSATHTKQEEISSNAGPGLRFQTWFKVS